MSRFSFLSFTRVWKFLVITTVLGGALAILFSFVNPLEYSSSVRVFITQLDVPGLDPYTALKSTERIAQSFSQLVYTATFASNVMSQVPGFDASYFPTDEYARRKLWKDTVALSITPDTGIMTVTVYHPSRDQAQILVDAVARQLALSAPNYFGSSVRVQVIDTPLPSRWFARPDFVTNGGFGLILGFLFGGFVVLIKLSTGKKED